MTELMAIYHNANIGEADPGTNSISFSSGLRGTAHLVARYIRKATASATKSMLHSMQTHTINSSSSGSGSSSEPKPNPSVNLNFGLAPMRSNVTRMLYMYFQNSSEESPPSGSTSDILSTHMVDRVAHVLDTTELSAPHTTTTTTSVPGYPWNGSSMSAAATAAAAAGSAENCSAVFANYTQPQPGLYCNWTWDKVLCWPPTPAGVLAHMNCPSGWHGVDARKFANRKCELDGHWGGRPNETEPSHGGWTDYGPCYKPEVTELMQKIKDIELYMDIAKRTRTLEIVGLCLSLLALIISLLIFCNFRSLRNNRTKIHKNLFIAMVLQVIVRLTIYLEQAVRRGRQETGLTTSHSGIENTPYLCEACYVLLEYARTAMFMWMFIEGQYLHNMVTVAVFQGNFPLGFFSLLGWGMPVLMTTVWAVCTFIYMDTKPGDCIWNYNLTPYYWILEGPRLVVILLNFCFLVNIIRVLVVKLRQSQASDIEQTRKAVRAAIVLLPLLGITNLLHLVPDLKTAWKFALWSYVTHFLTSFQGFFIALIYCFLNGEVRAVLLKSLGVYMSVRGHPEWVPKRASMYSGAYNTAPDTDALQQPGDALPGSKRVSPPNKRLNHRKGSGASIVAVHEPRREQHASQRQRLMQRNSKNNNIDGNNPQQAQILESTNLMAGSAMATRIYSRESPAAAGGSTTPGSGSSWMIILCFRGQKNKCVMPGVQMQPQIFMTSQQMPALTAMATTAAATKTTTTTPPMTAPAATNTTKATKMAAAAAATETTTTANA